ncbi:MAG: thioredoxin domain-containing protein [Acidobacteriia bacterium]|nr:thioredoxin domain-containing protein [Terriglobia bacterium]
MASPESANQLAHSRSSYLKTAAHQPIHWQEWSEAAFERASRERKPILVDVGAVWCHWCHVMDGESYENQEIAGLINEHYIAIKVDRDERPDIDTRLQAAVQTISGQGGWPLTAFLTPEGKPFFGGTYFPPEDRYGRPGFKRILFTLAEYYKKDPQEIVDQAAKLAEAIESVDNFVPAETALSPDLLQSILSSIGRSFDVRYGGFSSSPKFPHPAALDLLLDHYQRTGEQWALTTAETTLTRMAQGGVYDQVGGGFHRYSTDEHWTVPHFEKMSYDNSELLKNYVHAYQVTGNPLYRETAEGILFWIETAMSDRENGGFYASQDADTDSAGRDDGDYFTWTPEELKAALTPGEFEILRLYYGVEDEGDMHHNPRKNVLEVAMTPADVAARLKISEPHVQETLVTGKSRLRRARALRATPFVDQALYTGWNALMISACLEASRVFNLPDWRDFSLRTLDRLIRLAYQPETGMLHTVVEDKAGVAGLIDDQIHTVNALLDAFEVTLEKKYFDWAESVLRKAMDDFWDSQYGGFFDVHHTSDKSGVLALRRKPFQDAPTPSANSVAVAALLRLFHYTEKVEYREKAETLLKIFGEPAARYGLYAASYGLALSMYFNPPMQVVVIAGEQQPEGQALVNAAIKVFRLGKAVLRIRPSDRDPSILPPALYSLTKAMPPDSLPRAFVCSGFACSPPVNSEKDLQTLLHSG